ncbi:MAG: hypothetical protein Rubg2KO_28110 [Rubricoccaceae bacterium]
MGFFSDLKKNLTGGWADLSLSIQPGARGEQLSATISFSVRDEPVDVSKITMKVRCQEIVSIPERSMPNRPSQMHGQDNHTTSHRSTSPTTVTETLFTQEVVAAHARSFDSGASETFDLVVSIPAHLPPTLTGRNARYEWSAYASADMKGNDPDSGWVSFEVQ